MSSNYYLGERGRRGDPCKMCGGLLFMAQRQVQGRPVLQAHWNTYFVLIYPTLRIGVYKISPCEQVALEPGMMSDVRSDYMKNYRLKVFVRILREGCLNKIGSIIAKGRLSCMPVQLLIQQWVCFFLLGSPFIPFKHYLFLNLARLYLSYSVRLSNSHNMITNSYGTVYGEWH